MIFFIKRFRVFMTSIALILIPTDSGSHSFVMTKTQPAAQEDVWSGTVSFLEKQTGPKIVIYEWTMFASYRGTEGTAYQKIKREFQDGGKDDCFGEDDSLLEVDIDAESKTYNIVAYIPACTGTSISAAGTVNPMGQDVTAIWISEQPLGSNPNVLSGTLTATEGPLADGTITRTTHTWNLRKKCPPWNNPLTQKNINTLDARVSGPAARFIKRVNDELCIRLKVVSGSRTNAEQDELYAQGRTKPGKIISNAPGGKSLHNSGTAIDVHIAKDDGTIDLHGVVPPEVVEIARQEGFEWGGNWKKFKDYPHFEMKI